MSSDYGFSSDSIFTIHGLGKDWPRLRQHDPPYVKRQKNGHHDHEGHHTADEDEGHAGNEPGRDEAGTKHDPEGFEIIV